MEKKKRKGRILRALASVPLPAAAAVLSGCTPLPERAGNVACIPSDGAALIISLIAFLLSAFLGFVGTAEILAAEKICGKRGIRDDDEGGS